MVARTKSGTTTEIPREFTTEATRELALILITEEWETVTHSATTGATEQIIRSGALENASNPLPLSPPPPLPPLRPLLSLLPILLPLLERSGAPQEVTHLAHSERKILRLAAPDLNWPISPATPPLMKEQFFLLGEKLDMIPQLAGQIITARLENRCNGSWKTHVHNPKFAELSSMPTVQEDFRSDCILAPLLLQSLPCTSLCSEDTKLLQV